MPTNKYDSIIEQGGLSDSGQNPDGENLNKYDASLDKNRDEFDSNIRNSMMGALQKNPDEQASIISLAEETGLPRGTAERNFEKLRQRFDLNAIDYQKLIKESPITAESLTDRDFAMVGQDDIANLTGLEWLFSAVPKGFEKGKRQLELGNIGFRQIQGTVSEEDLALAEQYDKDNAQWLGDDGWFQSAAVLGAQELPQLFESLSAGAVTGIPMAIAGVELALIGGQAGPQALTPEEVVTVPASGVGGYILGSRLGSGAVNFKAMSGAAYRDLIRIKDVDGKPLDEDVARMGALATGLLNAGLEVVGIEKLAKFGGGDVLLDKLKGGGINRLLKVPTVQAALKDLAVRYTKGFTTEFSIEMAQEVVSILSEEISKGVSGQEFGEDETLTKEKLVERFVETGIKTAQALTFLVGAGPAGNFAVDVRRARKANRDQKTIEALGESAKASKVRERLPKKYKEYVNKIMENGSVENIYIPADKFTEYFQDNNIDLKELGEVIPEITAQINEAAALGADIVIPLDSYSTHIAPTEHHGGLAEDIRFQPGDFTMREAREFLESSEGRVAELVEKAAESTEDQEQFEAQLDVIQERLTQDLIAAGRTADIAKSESLPIREFFRSIFDRVGIDPLEFFENRGLRVEGVANLTTLGDTRGGGIFNQDDVSPVASEVEEITITELPQDGGEFTETTEPGSARLVGQAPSQAKDVGTTPGGGSPNVGWREATSVVSDGKPKTIYRGSSAPISRADFDKSSLGASTGFAMSGLGVFFTDDPSDATAYGPQVAQVNLDIRNPKEYDIETMPGFDTLEDSFNFREDLKSQGFDGIVMDASNVGGPIHYIAFDAEQVIGNKDQFSQERIFNQSDTNKSPKGRIVFSEDRTKTLIQLLEGANLSTFLHESGHFFLDAFAQIAVTTDNPQIQDDWAAILKWLNVESIDDIGTEQHEQWARGMEAYYFEGKAPSIELQAVFARFTEWLKRIYANIKNLNVELNDEVRAVMDRMLATDAQIEEVEQIGQLEVLWRNAEEAGMTESGFKRYVNASQKAADDARNNLLNKATKEIERERTKFWKEERKKMQARVEKEVNSRPVWQALDFLRTGVLPDQEIPEALQGVKISKRVLTDIYGAAFVQSLPKPAIYQSEGGLHPDIIADIFDFESGDQMLQEMINATRSEISASPLADVEGDIAGAELLESQTNFINNVRQAIKLVGNADLQNPKTLRGLIGYQPVPLHNFVKNIGGINDAGGELKSRGVTSKSLPGLVKKDKGLGTDEIAQRLLEEGYLTDRNVAVGGLSPDDVVDAITASLLEDNIYDDQTLALLNEFSDDFKTLDFATENEITANSTDEEILAAFTPDEPLIPEAAKKPRPRRKQDVIKEETDELMQATFGDMLNDGSIVQEAVDSVISDERGDVIALELKQLEKLMREPVAQSQRRDRQAGAQVKRTVGRVDAKFARNIAKRAIATKKLRNVQPNQYQAASLRASKKTHEAVAKRDFDAAVEFKQQQLISHYMYIEGRNAIDQSQKDIKYFKKFSKSSIRKTVAVDYLEQIEGLLERFQFKNISLKRVDKLKSLSEWIKEKWLENEPVDIPISLQNEANRKHYKEMTVDELVGLRDAVGLLETMGRRKLSYQLNNRRRTFVEVRDRLVAKIKEQANTKTGKKKITPNIFDKGKEFVEQAVGSLTKMSFMSRWIDDGKIGLANDVLIQPLVNAEAARFKMMRDIGQKIFDPLFNMPKDSARRLSNKVFIESLGTEFSISNIYSVALNMGNESNYDKMKRGGRDGVEWTDANIEEIVSHLTEDDWGRIQQIWDGLDLLRPELFALTKKIKGVEPPKIEAKEVVTKFGTFKGGYYPVIYDRYQNHITADHALKVESDLFGGNNFLRPDVSAGSINERTDFAAPILFELNVINNHVQEVIHFITHYEAVTQIDQMVRDPVFREAYTEAFGKGHYDGIRKWLVAVSNDGTNMDPSNYIQKIIREIRVGTSLVAMGFKASTGVMQLFGTFTTIDEVGLKYTLKGIRNTLGTFEQMKDAHTFAMSNSKVLPSRITNFDRDAKFAMDRFKGKSNMPNQIRAAAFMHIGYIQMYTVDLPAWNGAYAKSMDEKGDHDLAVKFADRAVEQTQGTGAVRDMAEVMRDGGEYQKAFTMFYTFFSVLFNRLRDIKRGQVSIKDTPETIARIALLITLPVIFESLFRGSRPEDDETWLEWMLVQQMLYSAQSIPFLRDAVNGSLGDYGYELTPVAGTIGAIVKATGDLTEEGELTRGELKNTVKAFGAVLKLPTGQAWNTGEHLYDVVEGNRDFTLNEAIFGQKRK